MSTPDRLRIASLLLAAPDSEGVVRAPLADAEALATIRAMPNARRAALSASIDWVTDYELNETPERHSGDPARETTA